MASNAILSAFAKVKSTTHSPKHREKSSKIPFMRLSSLKSGNSRSKSPENDAKEDNTSLHTMSTVSLFVLKATHLTTYTIAIPSMSTSTSTTAPSNEPNREAVHFSTETDTESECAICAIGARCGGDPLTTNTNTNTYSMTNSNNTAEDVHRSIGLDISGKTGTLTVKSGSLANKSGIPNGTHSLVLMNNTSFADTLVLTKYGKSVKNSLSAKPIASNTSSKSQPPAILIFSRSMEESISNNTTNTGAVQTLTLTLMPTHMYSRLLEPSKLGNAWV